MGRVGGNEGVEKRKEEEVGKGETASQRGEKGEEGLANMQLTSRLARFLESQVIRKLLRLHNLFQINSKPSKTKDGWAIQI